MKNPAAEKSNSSGFTLIEVLVSLLIATVVIGSTMALVGVSIKNINHVKRLRNALPVLDTAAQEIIRNPARALTSPLVLREFPNSPSVEIEAFPVKDPTVTAKLYRVVLRYGGETLVTSVIINEELERK